MGRTLRNALKNRDIKLYLQPIVELDSGRYVGAEALARWELPGIGAVLPASFLPLLERRDLMVELDFFMLEEACALLAYWRRVGIEPVPICVNQSRAQFDQKEYDKRVLNLLQKYEVSPEYITLELTEGQPYGDRRQLRHIGKSLRNIGVRLAVDDFGAGFSAMPLLQTCDVDIVKLDSSFLLEGVSSQGRAALEHVIVLAHALGATALCEGVETREQAELLWELGCPLAQGFLYSRPVPTEVFGGLLAENRSRQAAGCHK